jgi:diguanylate cyclase (GGDEF)-like protein
MADPRSASDSGTGIFSLTQIRHLMRVEFSRAQRYGYPLGCVVIGCDRLDHLRDLYGYAFRERVIGEVIELLQTGTRTCDYLGRLMDDRLMAILPHTGLAGAEMAAQRLIAAARGLSFEADGRRISISLSAGVSHYESENTLFFDSLVEAAEAAWLEAAQAGGDRMVVRAPGAPGAMGPTGTPGANAAKP